MNDWTNACTDPRRSDTAQGLVEYALIIALMCFAAAVAMETIAVDLNNAFTGISKVLSAAIP
ncbi:MAG: Flp family type IVb pilin [Acidobacteriota bacterium]